MIGIAEDSVCFAHSGPFHRFLRPADAELVSGGPFPLPVAGGGHASQRQQHAADAGGYLLRGNIILFADYRYSKSFGESTPNREAYRAHSSPNSPILPRLVKVPHLEGLVRHIVHQAIWHKASESSTKHSKGWCRALFA